MAAAVTGSKTITKTVAPHLTPAVIDPILATPIEQCTRAQLETILDAMNRVKSGKDPKSIVGTLLL
jgi:hypothetical protein